jgi:plasmid replication initiation protein
MKSDNKPVVLGNSEHIFVQANNFITAKYKDNMSFWEFLLIGKMCTMISPADTHFTGYTIYIKDLLKFLGISDSGNVYKYVLEAAERLLERRVVITYKDEDGREIELDTHLVAGVEKIKRPQKNDPLFVTLTFLPQLRPFLLQLKSDFTKFDFRNYQFLRTGSSIRLYHILKQYLGRRQTRIQLELEELKAMLGVADKYELYGHFKTRVLDEAFKRLRENTDIKFDYTEVKTGKKVTAILFQISDNTPKRLQSEKGKPDIFNALSPMVCDTFGVTEKVFQSIITKYSEDDIRKAVKITQKNIAAGKIKGSAAGFFVEAVREGYEDTAKNTQKSTKENTIVFSENPQDVLKQQKTEIRKQQYERERTQILQRLSTDVELRNQVIERMKHGLYHDIFDDSISFEMNLEKPIFFGAVINIVKNIEAESV